MSLANRVTTLLTSLTPNQLLAMSAAERQALSDQCQRVYRVINTERIVDDARVATEGVLSQLKNGHPRHGG